MRKIKEVFEDFTKQMGKISFEGKTRETVEIFLSETGPWSPIIKVFMEEIMVKDYADLKKTRPSLSSIPGIMREIDSRWRSFASKVDEYTWDHWGFKTMNHDGAHKMFSKALGEDAKRDGYVLTKNFEIENKKVRPWY